MDPALRDAALRIITAGYRAVAKTAHPDAGGSAEEMAHANAAVRVLRALVGAEPAPARVSSWTYRPSTPGAMCWGTVQRQRVRCVAIPDVWFRSETRWAVEAVIKGKPVWIPKSQIADETWQRGDGTLIVTAWIAEQKGWRWQ